MGGEVAADEGEEGGWIGDEGCGRGDGRLAAGEAGVEVTNCGAGGGKDGWGSEEGGAV